MHALFWFLERVTMLKKFILTSVLAGMCSVSGVATAAMDHGSHGRKGGDKSSACRKVQIVHAKPAHLATVARESEFTFWIKGIKDPELVTATAKKLPVALRYEYMTDYYLFTGKLPAEIKGSAARVIVEIETKKCPTEKGWLYKFEK